MLRRPHHGHGFTIVIGILLGRSSLNCSLIFANPISVKVRPSPKKVVVVLVDIYLGITLDVA